MDIHLNRDSVVDERTGEVSAPSEYLENLREIERSITRCDEKIGSIKDELKHARSAREELVAKLRAAVREGKVLPLLEAAEREDEDDDELDGGPVADED